MTGAATGKITIIGCGLIGGSIGLALKHANLLSLRIAGYDIDRGTLRRAEKLGAVDETEQDVSRAIQDSALIVIATPIETMRDVLTEVGRHAEANAVVTDTASTKAEVMRWAQDLLPPSISFVGGHPMAGKEDHG